MMVALKCEVDAFKESLIKAQEEIKQGKEQYQFLMRGSREKVIMEHNVSFNKALRQVDHKFMIPHDAEFDILMDIHEGTLMSIQNIPRNTPRTS